MHSRWYIGQASDVSSIFTRDICIMEICFAFYHDVGEIWWPQPIRLLKMGHVTGQGSTTTTWVGRVSDLGKNGVWKKFFFFLVNKFGYGLKKKCFDFMVWIFFFISQFDKTTRIISVWSEFYWISIGINYPTVVNKKRNIGKNNKWHVKYFCCCLFF